MFTEIHGLVTSGKCTLMLAIAPKGDKLSVRVTPIPSEKDAQSALSQPLDMLGTPQELDAEFSSILASYSTARKTLQQSLDDAETIMKAAANEASKKSVAAITKTPTAPAAKPVEQPASPPPADASEAVSQGGAADEKTLDLFD